MGSVTDYLIDVDKTICDNIHELSNREDLLSKNILSHLRNFVEQIAIYVTLGPNTTQSRDYSVITKALKQLSCLPKKYRFILEFHELLQISSSHYTLDSDSSIRLMRKYYHYLIKIKDFFEKEYSFALLENIWDYKLIRDSETEQYYRDIAVLLEHNDTQESYFSNERYYVQKIIPFYVNKKSYYEITVVNVFNKDNKMSRITAYSTFKIPNDYAVKLNVVPRTMNIYGTQVTISQIVDWQISIRPCELEHFAEILDVHIAIRSESEEYRSLMDYLTVTGDNLSKLVTSSGSLFNETISEIYRATHTAYFKCVLEKCRVFYINNNPGVNVILYLLQSLENELIKNQLAKTPCLQLSELKLKNGCIPFEKMPYVTSLVGHNPPIWSLLASIPIAGHEKELTVRQLKNKCETEVSIFIKKSELSVSGNIESDISCYNKSLYYKHNGRRIVSYKEYLFFYGYADNLVKGIRKVKQYVKCGIPEYSEKVTKWLNSGYEIDSDEKRQIILNMFSETRIACIYGSAGTGKTTILNHLFHFLKGSTKICLAVTNPAKDNLERKIDDSHSRFYTISTFLGLPTELKKCDLLVIDECSTVSNEDFQKILYCSEFSCAVFVGDTYQIESINFGNWFAALPYFIPKHCVNTLTVPYRSAEANLLKLWERARINEGDLLEYLTKYGFSKKVDESLFESFDNDQVILCLNYNGPFGINNINKIFQSKNPHTLIKWGLEEYKEGDPILFNTSTFLRPYIYNNMKGKIAAIEKHDSSITFDIELDTVMTDASLCKYLEIVSQNGRKTTVRFTINKRKNPDLDIDQPLTIVPFNVAYAVSIHKSQGLEYDSVKIIISDDVEEAITHNIFYTAITRARKNLNIFWSTNTEEYVLSHLKRHDPTRDVKLLRAIYPDLLPTLATKLS